MALKFFAATALVLLLQQGPPPGSPFPPAQDLPKLAMVGEWMQIGQDQLGWPPPYTLLFVAYLLQVPNYDLRQGVGPILARL